jgi:hypothetical protein
MHTPKHGSWLNLIEMTFSKMARSFLRRSRVLKGVAEMNAAPTVMCRKKFNPGIT